MRGRRPIKPEVYALAYSEGFFWTEYDADGFGSFAAVERSMLGQAGVCVIASADPILVHRNGYEKCSGISKGRNR